MGDTAGMTASQAASLQEASMATSAFSSIGKTFSDVSAIKAQGDYTSSISNTNAAIAKLKGSQVLQAGDIEASRKNLETQGQVGAARAAAGASGVDVNRGSPAIVQSAIKEVGSMDEATIRNNAARAAWGYQTESMQDTFEGQFAKLTAKSRVEQSIATGGLSAISNPLSMYSQSALWQYRYGARGTQGVPYKTSALVPFGGNTPSPNTSSDSDFWGGG